ncbi:MAG TPA: FGGY-family carbohydrate kinase [Spirochaetia bacterium]|nr:FGGY-family carbohydrate kinase [Spirochaetia bacterium]
MGGSELILSLDAGTQSVRAIVFDLAGNILAWRKEPLPPWDAPGPGWAELPADVFWVRVCAAVQGLWQDHPELKKAVACVTLTTQRNTLVAVDEDGVPLRPAILWLDQRTTPVVPPLSPAWRLLFTLAGQKTTLAYLQSQAKVNWLQQYEPHIWARTSRILFLSGYLTHRLTGDFVDSTGCQVGYLPFDYKRQQWARASDWKWQALAVDRSRLSGLVRPGERLGGISAAAAGATGIPRGTPLVAAAADKACEALGAGCLTPSQANISYGTAAAIDVVSPRYIEPLPLFPAYPSAVPGCYNLEVQVFSGFSLVSWFIREFGLQETMEARKMQAAPEEILDALIRGIPAGSQGLLVQPYWVPGLGRPGPEARGAAVGFRHHHTRAHLYRAVLEGLALALREGKERLEKRTGQAVTRLCVSGGGARSARMTEITADVFNLPVVRVHTWETAALGAAVVAAVGSKFFPGFSDALAAMVRYREAVMPDAARAAVYEEIYGRVYRRLYRRLQPLYREIGRMEGLF